MMLATPFTRAEAAAKTTETLLRVGIEPHAEPFSSSDATHPPRGFTVDLLNEVAADQQLSIQFVTESWETILKDSRSGKIDIVGNIAYTPERAAYLDFSVPFANSAMAVFVHKGSNVFHEYADLARVRIGTNREGLAHQYLLRHHFDQNIVFAESLRDALGLLDKGAGVGQ